MTSLNNFISVSRKAELSFKELVALIFMEIKRPGYFIEFQLLRKHQNPADT